MQYIFSEAYSLLKFGDSSAAVDVKRSATSDKIRPVDFTDELHQSSVARKKNVTMVRKTEIKPGFIPLPKASNIIPLLLQKPRDVANLDVLSGIHFSFLCCY